MVKSLGNNEYMDVALDLRGIDMVTPVDLLSDGHTPWSRDFRLYAQQSDSRQVAVSSRKGPGYYTVPLEEDEATSGITGGDGKTVSVGMVNDIWAQEFTAQETARINRVDLLVSKEAGSSGPLIISIYSNNDGSPATLLSQSSINSGDISSSQEWKTARFYNAPLITKGESVFVVFNIQDDGAGMYNIGVQDGTGAKYGETSFASMVDMPNTICTKIFTTPDQRAKGKFRFNREDGQNITVAIYGKAMYEVDAINGLWRPVVTDLNPLATEYSFARMDGKMFWVNSFDQLRSWDGTRDSGGNATGLETITDTELPILSQIIHHKDRIIGVAANDKNRIVWCEAPGNPSNAPTNKQWYRAWLSTSFWYIPAPKTGSPITGLVSFQDSLIIFTQDNKYVFSGTDKGSFNLRQSTGAKGALSRRGITSDENFIYFAADDGLYSFNGSADTNISQDRIQPLFDACPSKENITPVIWQNKVRWYMSSETSNVNDICPIYNRGFGGEWEMDLDTYIDSALYYDDADDNGELIEISSQYAMLMRAEFGYSSLGAPINFEYRFKYDSFGLPAQKKRLRRYFPILQGVDNTFKIKLSADKDFQNNPRTKDVLMAVNGSKWGEFKWGDGTTWGGDKSFKQYRQSYSGSAYYWQFRVSRKGVNNRVAFTGAQYKYRLKRM